MARPHKKMRTVAKKLGAKANELTKDIDLVVRCMDKLPTKLAKMTAELMDVLKVYDVDKENRCGNCGHVVERVKGR